jgi:hypothetical protein
VILLKEDASVLELALQSYLDGLANELKEKTLGGRGAELVAEYRERASRILLRIREMQKP